jgi:preprotein translocase subunit SecA
VSLAGVLGFLGFGDAQDKTSLSAIRRRQEELSGLADAEIRSLAAGLRGQADVAETFALTAIIAEQVLGLRVFDVQLLGALALQDGRIAEMQTGEGKTLAAVPAVVWYALQGRGVHVLTANDYLARRDAEWMGEIYRWFGLSVAAVSQTMPTEDRRAAWSCDVTYATANEAGFDFLRDSIALRAEELVQRPLAFAVIDEADSILIDEARIPLVIAAGAPGDAGFAHRVDDVAAGLRRHAHYFVDEFARNVQLTDAGIAVVERSLACGSLFAEGNLPILTAVQDSLQAHVLLRRDVDYVIRDGSVELVDEFRGRIASNRRWPAGLQSALEAKERLALNNQGRIVGSITLQSLAGMYERICGMTGTAATQADEFWKVYKLPVTVIPTNRPLRRHDLPDIVYADRAARDRAVVEEIRKVHEAGRPMLVGTGSVKDSEALSRLLEVAGIPHLVLNARNDQAEAEIIAQAGAFGAVTVSTNIAGRGTDILLGGNPPDGREAVMELGGLYVIGTTRHEARRIDNQLRGRAGRQGDPGSSRFFLSVEDDFLVRFGIAQNDDIDSVQRTAESQNLQIREMLWKYEIVVENHRREIQELRREVLLSADWCLDSMLPEEELGEWAELAARVPDAGARKLVLAAIDDLWSDYLANVSELKGGIHWVSWGGRDPLYEFLTGVKRIYADLHERLDQEVLDALQNAEVRDGEVVLGGEEKLERGATWTYLTTDQPFGTLSERFSKGIRRKFAKH